MVEWVKFKENRANNQVSNFASPSSSERSPLASDTERIQPGVQLEH